MAVVAGNLLSIKGETQAEERVEKGDYLRQERRFGQFQRSLQLPDGLMADKAEASFKDGVLTLNISRQRPSPR